MAFWCCSGGCTSVTAEPTQEAHPGVLSGHELLGPLDQALPAGLGLLEHPVSLDEESPSEQELPQLLHLLVLLASCAPHSTVRAVPPERWN